MYERLSLVDVLAAVQSKVTTGTSRKCYDTVPTDAPMPFYAVELVGTIPEPSKTMQKDRYQVVIHAFADGKEGSVSILETIKSLEEALTEEIELPEPYEVTLQIPNGVTQIFPEADGSKHAVIGYDFVVFSGYKMKI